jgi:hypothetical protein
MKSGLKKKEFRAFLRTLGWEDFRLMLLIVMAEGLRRLSKDKILDPGLYRELSRGLRQLAPRG